jgi:hypothetical protein
MSKRLIGEIFGDLQGAVEAEDDARCLSFAQEVLAQEHNDVDALHCALVAQIHLSKYEDVVSAANSVGDEDLRDGFRFEHAYALYRLSRFEEALKVLSPLEKHYDTKDMDVEGKKDIGKESSVPSVLLKAQIVCSLVLMLFFPLFFSSSHFLHPLMNAHTHTLMNAHTHTLMNAHTHTLMNAHTCLHVIHFDRVLDSFSS